MTDQPATDFFPVDFWRSLYYFNLYRLTLASLLVFFAGAFGVLLSLSARDWMLFFVASLVYALVVMLSFVPLRLRWPRFTWQLAFQIGCDIVGLTILSYANGGIRSGIGLLLLVSLAAAGLISRGKITLFFAALASIAALLEHSYAVLYDDELVGQYVQVGLLCMAYFAVAWLAHTLAKYAVDSQLLAQRRGRDLVSLTEASRLVMRDMQDGVLVVDGQGMIMQMNLRAERLLHKSVGTGSSLLETFPVLFREYVLWKQTGSTSREILQLDMRRQVRLRFVAIEQDVTRGIVIFLEDMQRVQAEAQQIKLAALGRLTANIAHEVRNPLSAISYATELLREGVTEGYVHQAVSPSVDFAQPSAGNGVPDLVMRGLQENQFVAKQQRLLQIVMDNTQRINQIVQDVMQLNRRDRAQPEVFELDAMLRSFVEEFVLAERVEPGVLVFAGMPAVVVSFDRGHLRQVLWNLCRNALRYGRRLAGSLRLEMVVEDGRVILDVQDDGPGILAEHQGKLFEPFFTTASEGTGLGLYIAKELCEANGARLEYHAVDGRVGACFRITFINLHRDGEGLEHG